EGLIARGLAKGAGEPLGRALMVALVQFVEGFDHPARRIQQTLTLRVLADIAQQGLHRRFGLGTRRARLVGANRGSQEFGRIELGGPGFRRLGFWAEGLDQGVHVNSVRPVTNETGVSPADGAACRQTPESDNSNIPTV